MPSSASSEGAKTPMASLFDTFKEDVSKVLTPITDRLRSQFGIGAPAPSSTKLSTDLSTPLADNLRSRFNLSSPPAASSTPSFMAPYTADADRKMASIEANTSPFLKNVFATGGSLLRSLASAGDSFLNTSAENVADFASGKLTLHPDDWIKGLEDTGVGALKLTGTLAQGFNQGVLRIGTSIADTALPGYREQRIAQGDNPMLESITGMPKMDTYQDIFKGANMWALDKAATPTGAKTFAGFVVLGSLFMDEPGIGSGAKPLFTLSKDAIERTAKETTDEGIKQIILSENPNISQQAAEFITPLLRDAKTPEEVKQITQFVQGSQKTAQNNAEKRAVQDAGKQGYEPLKDLAPEQIDSYLAELDTPEIQAARAKTANGVPTATIDTPERNELRDMIVRETYGEGAAKQEKRLDLVIGAPASGKSTLVEDLAREHGSIVPDADAIKKQFPEYGLTGEGSQLVHGESTVLAAEVRRLARERGDNTILQMVGNDAEQIKKNIKIYHDAGYDVHLHHVELPPEKAAARAVERYKNGGHFIDPAYILREVGIKPSQAYDIVKSDERLKSFQKLSNDVERGAAPRRIESGSRSAQKESERLGRDARRSGDSPRAAAKAEVSPNLVKSLGKSKDPYAVLNILKNEFPNLPDRVIDRMVERFVRTKRIENIEALVRSGRELNARFKQGELITKAPASTIPGEKKLPQSSKEILEKSVNPTVRKVMRQDQKERLIATIKNRFEDPKEAVAAQHEYDRIWDDVNQQIVERYENLGMQKSFLEDALAADDEGIAAVYKKLFTGRNKGNDAGDSIMELQEIHNRAARKNKAIQNYKRTGASGDKKYPGNPGKLTKTEEYAVKLDGYLVDAGIEESGAWDIAQKKIERYAAMRAEVKDIGEQLKELKPRVREARILQEGLGDIAVVPKENVQAIDRIATQANFRDEFKDISGFSGQARDIYRNFEKFFGKKYEDVKKAVLDPFDDAKGRFVDENKALADSLDGEVVKKFGIRRGSEESAAIQRYGDTDLPEGERMSYKDLSEKFGKEKADNIVAADKYFREQYDRLIDELNAVRKKIYPNTPGKLIAKRANYYRHFTDMAETWGDALREFFDTPSGIDPNLVGLSEFTKAKTRFLAFAEARKSQSTNLDAVGGFVDYIPAFAYAKEIDPQISTFRYLRSKLAEAAPKAGEELKLPDGKTFKSKGAEAMLGFLDDFSRDLTGNTNPMDRWVQRIVGRRNIRAARFVNNRMKANSVTTFGSALAQIFNVPAGIADTKQHALKGLTRSFGGLVAKNEPMAQSIFLKERFSKSLGERFPFQFKDKPMKATGDALRKQVSWVLRTMDEAGTRFIWNSEYEKGLALKAKGKIEDPIRYADGKTRKMVAGRGIGEVPLGQKALTTQFIAPFTLEVGNAWWIMRDWVKEKDAAALLTFFVANYTMNEIAERVRGSRVAIDPINSMIQGAAALSQEWKEGNYARGGIKFLGRQAGELLANIPFGQQLAAIAPDEAVQAATKTITGAPMNKQEVFGDANISGRFGTPLIVSGLQDAVFRLLPPVGGIQLKKTYQGLLALVKGQAEDSKGNETFKVPRSPQNVARALMFGANATSESRSYFDERTDLFNRVDRQTSETFVRNASAEKDWADMKKLVAAGKNKEAGDLLAEIATNDPLEAKAVAAVAADERAGLTGNDRLIKMLNVQNGERAKYIAEQLKKMKTGDEKAAYVADLAAKKLVTKDVVKQLAALMAAGR